MSRSRCLSLLVLLLLVPLSPLRSQSIYGENSGTGLDSAYHNTSGTDSLGLASNYQPNALTLSFDHVLSLYEWRGRFRFGSLPYLLATPSSYDVRLTGYARLREEQQSLTTEWTGLVTGDQSLLDKDLLKAFLTLYATSYVTSGSKANVNTASLITQQADGFGIAGLRTLLPESDVRISAGGGITRQSQPRSSTYGSIFRADLDAPLEEIGESSFLSASASLDERFFAERDERFSNDRAQIRTTSNFIPDVPSARNDASLAAGLLRRDFFIDYDSTRIAAKQSRRELSLLIVDSVTYPLVTRALDGMLGFEFEPRSITRRSDAPKELLGGGSLTALSTLLVPNEVNSLRIAANGRLSLLTLGRERPFGAMLNFRYDEHTENVALLSNELAGTDPTVVRRIAGVLDEASFSSRTTQSMLALSWQPGVSDLFQLDGNARLLAYDTPSEENHDDHDELVTGARLSYSRMFSDRLTGLLEVRGSRMHLVYLKSDRSAQNSVTRSLGVATQSTYYGEGFYTDLRGEVFANYTVLDYLDSLPILQSVGSYVLRGVSIRDSSSISLALRPFASAGPFQLQTQFDLRINERGSFVESDFSERRSTRITELSGEVLLSLSGMDAIAPWYVAAGVRGFLLSQAGQSSITLLSTNAAGFTELQRQSRLGPYASVSLFRNDNGPTLTGSIWYAIIRSQTFDTPTFSSTPQLESHLQIQWRL